MKKVLIVSFTITAVIFLINCGAGDGKAKGTTGQKETIIDKNSSSKLERPLESIDHGKLIFRNGFYYKINSKKPYTGKAIRHFAPGKKYWQHTYKNGIKEGESITWYNTGQKKYLKHFKNGIEHGLYIKWYKNGQKNYECHYKEGRRHGKLTSWHKNGQKSYETSYVNGQKEGKYISWDETGKLKFEKIYRDGIEMK